MIFVLFFREGNGTPLQYSCLENPMDGGAWKAAVHGVAEGQTWLSDFTFTFHFDGLEKEMATHSSVLAWRIPGTAESGGLPSMGSHRVGHDWSDLAAAAATVPPGKPIDFTKKTCGGSILWLACFQDWWCMMKKANKQKFKCYKMHSIKRQDNEPAHSRDHRFLHLFSFRSLCQHIVFYDI